MKCKGVLVPAKGEVRLTDVEVTPPGPAEVQVRMASTLISSGTERAFILGLPNAVPASYPYVPGYCCAGVVETVGSDVHDFAPGDRVACFAVDVGHREIGNVPVRRVAHMPDGIGFDQAAFTSLGQTSLQGVRKCRIELGESVAVMGLGIVGQLALQLASANGALPVIGIDRIADRLETARRCGAQAVIDNTTGDLGELIRPVTKKGTGADVVLECTGVPEAMNGACLAAADYGRVCILGCPRGTVDFNFYRLVQKKSITVIGAHAVDSIPLDTSYPNFWTFRDDAECFMALVEAGKVVLEPLIHEVVSWKDAESVYRRLLRWDADIAGIVINWPSHD